MFGLVLFSIVVSPPPLGAVWSELDGGTCSRVMLIPVPQGLTVVGTRRGRIISRAFRFRRAQAEGSERSDL